VCGNGRVEQAEACDDGNGAGGDGCENDCTFSCVADADCDDAKPCNGAESCDASHVCESGPPLEEGAACGSDLACRAGSCALLTFGDTTVDAGEDCDDGNTAPGDGCENDCRFTCAADAECQDGTACNGTETCDPSAHTCTPGTPHPDGTLCDRDGMPGTSDVCLGGDCVRSVCGDGFTDTATGEECDDGNTAGGDACNADCTLPCEADGECDDGEPCNGAETCDSSLGACVPGTAAPDGTACALGTCASGACLTTGSDAGPTGGGPSCGTSSCDSGEQCCRGGGCYLCVARSGPCPRIACEF
jgi:cysteine-rich repeat protein